MKDPDRLFEEKLKNLVPEPANPELRLRIARRLAGRNTPGKYRGPGVGLAAVAAAAVAIAACWVYFFEGSRRDPTSGEAWRTIGQEQILVGVSAPNFVEAAGAEPMWEIEMQILNRAIVEKPGKGRETILVPERRKVFLPASYQ